DPPKLPVGTTTTVTGIVRNYSDGPRVLPRMPEDLQSQISGKPMVLGAQDGTSRATTLPT
ncbi:MAG: hypothetical protein AAB733_03370, partial [Patescibacteria group bacterium]